MAGQEMRDSPLNSNPTPQAGQAEKMPPGLSAAPDAMSLFKAFRRRWLLASSLAIAVALAAFVAVWLIMPAKFAAFSLLQVSANRTSLGWGIDGSRNDFVTYLKTQAARIKSRDVLVKALSQDAVRNLNLIKKHPDTLTTLTWLEENLKVDYQDGSELLTLSLADYDPAELTVVVNAITKSYLNILSSQEKTLRKDRVAKTKMLYEQAKEKLSEKVAAREALAKGQGAQDIQAMQYKQQLLNGLLSRAQEQHQQAQFELEKKQVQMANLETTRKKVETITPPDFLPKELQDTDQQLKLEVGQLAGLRKLVDRMINEGHPPTESTLVQTKKKLTDLEKKINDRTEELRVEYANRFRKKAESDLVVAIDALQVEMTPLQGHVKKLLDKIDQLTKDTEALNISTARNQVLEGEIVQLEHNVSQLHQKMAGFVADEESEGRVQLVSEAEWQMRDSKKRIFLLILAPLAALLVTLLGVAWLEFAARRIHEPDEVAQGLALRVVGAVPALPDPRRQNKPEEIDLYRHSLIESIDAIRTTLLRNAQNEQRRVVMVTSAVAGEGKTTLASNLAMSLARAGRRTLLLDCDLRRPAVHQLFEQTLQPGFSEVVLGEVELPDAVRPTTTDPNLFMMAAGSWDREVVQGLARNGIENIFEKLRAEFDFIVVDSHPVLPATDSLLIGQQVDAVIISVMRDVSQAHHVHGVTQQLTALGIRVFGAVVNGVPVQSFGKRYQYTQPAQPAAA
ncbi:MAG: polysaccharide biosynthesis tyrosine autokinase [Gemmataceae bacterium]|nr:polysaccharide biosynthesis tyrosine autokinase [Gemmataceae bacterium]MCI0739344.1 polysaccharide biosynthesis tyrosine autokinase [Gemmataceae bacterium]